MAQQSPVGQGLLIVEASRSHSGTPHSVGHLWTNDQPDAETSTRQHTTLSKEKFVTRTGFELAVPEGERPKTARSPGSAVGCTEINQIFK